MQPATWRVEANGDLSANIGDLRLVVQAPRDGDPLVHFMLFRRPRVGEEYVLLASGTEANLQAAKASAVRLAKRSSR